MSTNNPFSHRLVRRLQIALVALIAVFLLAGWFRHEGWLPESWQRLISFDDILKFGIILGMVGSTLVTVAALSIAIKKKHREGRRTRGHEKRPGQP